MNFIDYIKCIEINPTELCNLKCTFCPRAFDYPNQNLHMSLETAQKIRRNLDEINFSQALIFAGRGEPTLTKNFVEILRIFMDNDPKFTIFIITNGKRLDKLQEFFNHPQVHFHYDVYDTDKNVFVKESERYASIKNIRCLWRPDDGRTYATHDRANEGRKKNKYESWGVSTQGFTNRGGALGDNKFTITEKGCGKLIFNMFIDWNGNYNLCCDDWTPLVLGNIFEESIEDFINKNETLSYYRKQHFCSNSRDGLPACQTCNRVAPPPSHILNAVQQIIKMDEIVND
jgi:MoaA/NifB/PqqE/SkfB family radical SAM enzyme